MRHLASRRRAARVAAIAAALCTALPAQAALAQTLDGERFESAQHIESFTYDGQCNPDGPSTFSYASFGYAHGPYAGTYSTYGTVTLASPSGPVTEYSAQFDVDALGSYVTGTKTLAGEATGSCSPDGGGSLTLEIPARYTVDSPFAETGPARVSIAGEWSFGTLAATFGNPAPTGPTSKEDCMNGGWEAYGFKNQGQCIAYVESRRGGRD